MKNKILTILEWKYGSPGTALKHNNPWQLMIATILSAQCTDDRVNKVTPALFRKYKSLKAFADADLDELKEIIRSTGYFNQKAKRIKESAKMVINNYNGRLPDDIEELIKIPGIGRKTANIIITYGFGGNQGIAVDTHVRRLSYRLGLTESKNPEIIERDLKRFFAEKDWPAVNSLLIEHGREVCKSRKPLCTQCVLRTQCLKKGVFNEN